MTPTRWCVACGGQRLEHRWRVGVGSPAGPEALIPTTDRFGEALSDIVRCTACGHMQLARFPPDASLIEGYTEAASTDYLDEEPGQRASARRTLEAIECHVRPGALLDVGCWLGFLLDEARARGWSTLGLEPSEFASRHARDRLGLAVQVADLFGAELPPGAFDAVALADVIEHFPDPGAVLDRVALALAPGGVLFLALPDAGSRLARLMGSRWWSVIPTHVQYFTRSSLAILLARHGWELLEISTAPKSFTVRYYLGRVGGYSPALSRSLEALARAMGVADRLWTPDFRDRMAVLARHRDDGLHE